MPNVLWGTKLPLFDSHWSWLVNWKVRSLQCMNDLNICMYALRKDWNDVHWNANCGEIICACVFFVFENSLQGLCITLTRKYNSLEQSPISSHFLVPPVCLTLLCYWGFFEELGFSNWCRQHDCFPLHSKVLIRYARFPSVCFILILQEKVTENSIYLQSAWSLFLLLMVIKSQR